MDDADLADRCARADPEVFALGGAEPDRSTAVVGGIRCVALGVPHPWATSAHAVLGVPEPQQLRDVLAWMHARAREAVVVVRTRDVAAPVWSAERLTELDRLPVLARPGGRLDRHASSGPPGVLVRRARDRAEFVAAYGGWMGDAALGEGLVGPFDLSAPARIHLVAETDGRVVGCVLVRLAAATGYISALGVLPADRGIGYGTSLTVAAHRAAVSAGCETVWMHATEEGKHVYQRLGFREVDEHVHLLSRHPGAASGTW